MKKFILLALVSIPLYAEFGTDGYVFLKEKKSTVAQIAYYPNKDFLLIGSESLDSKWYATFNEKGQHQKTFTSTLHAGGGADTQLLKDSSIFQHSRIWISNKDSRIVVKKITKDGMEDLKFGKFGEKLLSTGSAYEQSVFSFELDNGNVAVVFYKDDGNVERIALMQVTPQGEIDKTPGVQIFEDKGHIANRGAYLKKYGIFLIHQIYDQYVQAYTKVELILYGLDGKRIRSFGTQGLLSYAHPKGIECHEYGFEEDTEGNLIIHNVCGERGRSKFYQNLYRYDRNGKLISHVETPLPIHEYHHKVYQNGEVFFIEYKKENLKIRALDSEGRLKETFGQKGVVNFPLPVPPYTDTTGSFFMTHASIDPQGRILLVYSVAIREPNRKYYEPVLIYRILPDGRLDT